MVGVGGVGVWGFNSFIISWDKRSLFLKLSNRKVGCILEICWEIEGKVILAFPNKVN